MIRLATAALAALTIAIAAPAIGALAKGLQAPRFTAKGAIAGKPVTINLEDALRSGPVVLYFFPAAFTPGCNAEANAFARAMNDFKAAGATVIGMTGGNIHQLEKFSAKECAGRFAVAVASPAIIKAYDVELSNAGGSRAGWSNRTTYVIDRKGRVAFTYSDMRPDQHIASSLAAVRQLSAR